MLEKVANTIVDVVSDVLMDAGELGESLIDRQGLPFHSSEWTVVFTIGSPSNSCVVFRGTHQECCKYHARKLPSINDVGWQDAWKGTNPFQEACKVVGGRIS